MLQCGEKPKDPTWNRMEKYVLKSLVDHLVENGEFTNETDLTSSYELVDIVNEIPDVNLLLHKKSNKVVQQMKKTIQQAELFQQLYIYNKSKRM
jgi:polyhydroxyalkanoate synthesis regulator phasin